MKRRFELPQKWLFVREEPSDDNTWQAFFQPLVKGSEYDDMQSGNEFGTRTILNQEHVKQSGVFLSCCVSYQRNDWEQCVGKRAEGPRIKYEVWTRRELETCRYV